MQAIILAGGKGTRLRPLTQEVPKPMIPVAGRPLLDYTLTLCAKHGITDIGMTLLFLPDQIRLHYGDGSAHGCRLTYFEETKPLGTAGSVKLAENQLDDVFVVLSGDALTTLDLSKVLLYHRAVGAEATIVLSKKTDVRSFGVVLTDPSGKILSFLEKPEWEDTVADTVNTGIYVLNKSVLEKIPPDREFDFGKDLFPLLLREQTAMYGYIATEYWCDLGTPETYRQANEDVLSGLFPETARIDPSASIAPTVRILPPVCIGENVRVEGESTIGPFVVIGKNCLIQDSALSHAVIWENSRLISCEGERFALGAGSMLEKTLLSGENTVGSDVHLTPHTHLRFGAKIKNHTETRQGAVITGREALSPRRPVLFENGRLVGVWGEDIQEEQLKNLAAAFSFPKILIGHSTQANAVSGAHLLAGIYALAGATVYLMQAKPSAFRYSASVHTLPGVYVYETQNGMAFEPIDNAGRTISSSEQRKLEAGGEYTARTGGRIISVRSPDRDFEYFLNRTIPFSAQNTALYTDFPLMLHNVITSPRAPESARASVRAQNGTVTEVQTEGRRLSTEEYHRLLIDLTAFWGESEVFLPPYASGEIRAYAKEKGIRVLEKKEHRGEAMRQTERFCVFPSLLAIEQSFFDQLLAVDQDREAPRSTEAARVSARYTFEAPDACRAIRA
ncbi:MAG: NDP-sugar synthase, partial [Clostridia bacterium]|nr:NDP-sugar synthase [Clostridia bacterium]